MATTIEFASPPSNINDFVDAFHDGEEVRFCRMDNIVGEAKAPGLASCLLKDPTLLLMSIEEPISWQLRRTQAGGRRC
jgi:hypothetical protein